MTECSKQIFSTDTIGIPLFWSLMSADASLRAGFRASNFGFIQAPMGV
jgi:hypothetical protein